eukprot:TRINITY_DN82770_c0_g1_i1.p1 TRINITY_DN82770_c0_g1~~TRINITY_DN82770_c0_g1_i1.p1  ORF type:complete len:277 (+),score=30.59 TRINITY_DN82770_c0_g1_i1:79-909(+)
MAIPLASRPWSREVSAAYSEQEDGYALSEVLAAVQSLILEHQPLIGAFLLEKIAVLVNMKGFAVSLADWSQAVDAAASVTGMRPVQLSKLQERLQNEKLPSACGARRKSPLLSSSLAPSPEPFAFSADRRQPCPPMRVRRLPAASKTMETGDGQGGADQGAQQVAASRTAQAGIRKVHDVQDMGVCTSLLPESLPCISPSSSRSTASSKTMRRPSWLPDLRDSLDKLRSPHFGQFVRGPATRGDETIPDSMDTWVRDTGVSDVGVEDFRDTFVEGG